MERDEGNHSRTDGGACCLPHSDWKDMVHVGAVFAFDAAALHVELAQLLDEVVAALNVLQLAVVPLRTPAGHADNFVLVSNETSLQRRQQEPTLMHLPHRKWRQSRRPSSSSAFCSWNS